jgi:hypothetical protein
MAFVAVLSRARDCRRSLKVLDGRPKIITLPSFAFAALLERGPNSPARVSMGLP